MAGPPNKPTAAPTTNSSSLSIPEDRPAPRFGDSDILVRDSEGNIQAEPPIPIPEQDEDSGDNNDDRDEAAAHADALRLINLYKTQRDQHFDPGEVRTALQILLRAKVAGLEKDKWMYEVEDDGDGVEKA